MIMVLIFFRNFIFELKKSRQQIGAAAVVETDLVPLLQQK